MEQRRLDIPVSEVRNGRNLRENVHEAVLVEDAEIPDRQVRARMEETIITTFRILKCDRNRT